jgi:hypothetical protein
MTAPIATIRRKEKTGRIGGGDEVGLDAELSR